MEATGLRMDRGVIDEQVQDLMEERDSSLAAFIEMLDTELPKTQKLPRLRMVRSTSTRKPRAPSGWAPRSSRDLTPAVRSSC